ncbi:MAG: hypothetical protein HDS50_02610 [Bacteroides sp.]|nr:hypothetical protein [Bacteroides sp.]
MIKKTFFALMSGCIIVFTACSSEQSKSADNQRTEETAEVAAESIVAADASNASQPYAEYVDFGDGVLAISGSNMLEIVFKPKIKKAANRIHDNDATELILLDASGKKLAKLHPFGRDSRFEEAISEGDELYKDKFTFIKSAESAEEAQEIVKNAKSFTLVLPLKEKPVNKFADWDPVGTYKMTDSEGKPYTLIVKKGGSAELINESLQQSAEYTPSKGSWTKNSEEGFLNMSFFGGPFITIADHLSISSPVLTPDYFYYDERAYKDDSACLEVKKVN